ncbi:MAG: DNA alkylation repair protein [Bacteroidota bacterium]
MTYQEVIDLLQEHANDRGIKHWARTYEGPLKTFGIGLTQLKKLSKKVGRNHELALELWESEYWDAKQMACLVEEPKKVTREQVEAQIPQMKGWMATHVYVSNVMPKVACQQELAVEYIESTDDQQRRCGWLMLSNIAKNDKKLDDAFFKPYIAKAKAELQGEENFVKDAMNGALLYIGQRSAILHKKCLSAAEAIGAVEVDYGDNSCVAVDVVKHLSNPRILKKVGVA